MHKQISRKPLIVIAAMCLLALACNQPFDPRGPVDQHLLIFTVLSTDRSTQFVRVTAPYMPSGFDVGEFYTTDLSVTDATVDIWGPGEHYQLKDTLLARPDASQYTSPLHLYSVTPFVPRYGKKYDVYVSSASHGNVASSVMVPEKPLLQMFGAAYFILKNPSAYEEDAAIEFSVTMSSLAKGYVARLYLDYDVLKGSDWVPERIEVPISSADTSFHSLDMPVYPQLAQCASSSQLTVSFKNGYLKWIIYDLICERYRDNKRVFREMVFALLQADPNLYSYYVASQLERDPRSIRLDQPLYPRISGGSYGLIGAYTLDSLVSYFPNDFYGNQR